MSRRLHWLIGGVNMLKWLRRFLGNEQAEFAERGTWETNMTQLAQLLAELRLLDCECATFGASKHRYSLRAPLTEVRLSALEALYQFRLPEDYRAFLRYVGDGEAGPGFGLESFENILSKEEPDRLATPFPYTAAVTLTDKAQDPRQFANGCLWLAHHGCGYFDLLVVSGPTRGQMWTVDADGGRGVAPLSCTFYEWYLSWLNRSLRELGVPTIPQPKFG